VLTWTDQDGKEHPSSSYWEGTSPIAGYQVSKFTDGRFPKVSRKFCLRVDNRSTKEQEFGTLDQAKEAAENHYRQRVEVLLENPPPQSRMEAVVASSATTAPDGDVTNHGCKSDLHPEYVTPAGDA